MNVRVPVFILQQHFLSQNIITNYIRNGSHVCIFLFIPYITKEWIQKHVC